MSIVHAQSSGHCPPSTNLAHHYSHWHPLNEQLASSTMFNFFSKQTEEKIYDMFIPDICHLHHLHVGGEKICHVEKFQNSIKNLNNLWSFYRNLCLFCSNLCGEKFSPKVRMWRKNDKYQVCFKHLQPS